MCARIRYTLLYSISLSPLSHTRTLIKIRLRRGRGGIAAEGKRREQQPAQNIIAGKTTSPLLRREKILCLFTYRDRLRNGRRAFCHHCGRLLEYCQTLSKITLDGLLLCSGGIGREANARSDAYDRTPPVGEGSKGASSLPHTLYFTHSSLPPLPFASLAVLPPRPRWQQMSLRRGRPTMQFPPLTPFSLPGAKKYPKNGRVPVDFRGWNSRIWRHSFSRPAPFPAIP